MDAITKTSESEFTITSTPVVTPIVTTYSIDDLKTQELTILKSMNNFMATQQIELDKVRVLITQATSLGLKTSEEIQATNVTQNSDILKTQVVPSIDTPPLAEPVVITK